MHAIICLKGFATFWEFSFYGQIKVADYEYKWQTTFTVSVHFTSKICKIRSKSKGEEISIFSI